MSSVAAPSNPCLVAIILVVQSRAGPRLVYHYPPNPLASNPSSRRDSISSTLSSDSGDSSSSEDDNTTIGASSIRPHANEGEFALPEHILGQQKKARNPDDDEDDTSSPEGRDEENYKAPWETVLGFSTDALEKLLCPTRMWHKRRFEIGINDLAFIGWPVFVREDGRWQKKRRRKRREHKERDREGSAGAEIGHEPARPRDEANGEDVDEGLGDSSEENTALDGDERDGSREDLTRKTNSTESDGTPEEGMTMFNVVFVLNPPTLEYPLRVKDMYENIIKKFTRALKWEQARVDYVWKDSQTILGLKEKARESRTPISGLYAETQMRSSLARAISSVYTSISSSRIASVHLTPRVSISLQIPPIASTSVLPSATDTPIPGIWLTTADSIGSPADDPTVSMSQTPTVVSQSQLAKHFALLLLESESSILKDIDGSAGELASALAHYIQRSTPTKSFAQISTLYGIPLAEIQILAQHLVYWRRARAIPPLHQRDTYIVSPNADLKQLAAASVSYTAAFPTLPSLPKMLSALSGPPRNYGSIIPSKDHKEAYFAILAWLLRGGWVTQLRTFAWVRVSGEVKKAVAEQMAREDVERQVNASMSTITAGSTAESTSPVSPGSSPPISRTNTNTITNGHSTHHTSVASSLYARFSNAHSRNPSTVAPTPSACLLLAPHRATPLESRWLDYLASSFPQTTSNPPPPPTPSPTKPSTSQLPDSKTTTPRPSTAPVRYATDSDQKESSPPSPPHPPDDLSALWPIFVKYLNGHDALEKIAVREAMKRKRVWWGLNELGVFDSGTSSTKGEARRGGHRRGGGGSISERGRDSIAVRSADIGNDESGDDGEKKPVNVGRRVVGVRHW